jgi:hypothetical protein
VPTRWPLRGSLSGMPFCYSMSSLLLTICKSESRD